MAGLYRGRAPKPYYCPIIPAWLIESRIAQGNMRINEGTLEKYCPSCSEWMPADTEFFHIRNRNADGLASPCRFCALAYADARYQETKAA